MVEPTVSVILTYLDKPLDECVWSIRNQTYDNVELIQGTESDFGIKEKKGIGWVRNRLSQRSNGQILLFMDSDAEMYPNFIEEIMKIFEEHNPDAISGLPVAPKREETDFLSYLLGVEYEARIRAIGEGFVSVGSGTCLAVRRKAFEDIGGFIETKTVGEDWAMSAEFEKRGYKIWHTNKAKVVIYKWETFWKYLKKQFKYSHYRIFHAKKFKHTTDEYPLMKTDYSKYNLKEKIVFPFFWSIRASVWLLGMIFGIFYYVILRRSVT